jgi:anti-anti-sigma factor
MNITESTKNDIRIIQPQGRIDSEGALDLELSLQEAYQEGGYQMILDLSQVSYINSAGLRILADMLTRTQGSGGDLLLAGPSQKIRRILQIIGFDNFFRLFDNVDLAVQAF